MNFVSVCIYQFTIICLITKHFHNYSVFILCILMNYIQWFNLTHDNYIHLISSLAKPWLSYVICAQEIQFTPSIILHIYLIHVYSEIIWTPILPYSVMTSNQAMNHYAKLYGRYLIIYVRLHGCDCIIIMSIY